jgi:serine O-acetyltransferase
MKLDFYKELSDAHQTAKIVPPTCECIEWSELLVKILFPGSCQTRHPSQEGVELELISLQLKLQNLLILIDNYEPFGLTNQAEVFFERLQTIYNTLKTDVVAILSGDPAAKSEAEVILTYPGFFAIVRHRIAHELYRLKIPLLPRIISENTHQRTGIDIHPGAQIEGNFCIDHGTGIVIGETTQIGQGVKIYQGVTLGALSVSKDQSNTKRHPTIENDVVIYANATILGGNTVIGSGSIIGGSVWVTRSVPALSKVYHKPQVDIQS